MHHWAPPQQRCSPRRRVHPRGGYWRRSRPLARQDCPGWAFQERSRRQPAATTAPRATPVRLRPTLGPKTPRFDDRGGRERHPIPRPGIGPSHCLLAFPFVLLKQRQPTPPAIFSLPQKPPLRQTPVSSFSAMPPASARWEMKAREQAAPRVLLLPVPVVQKTTIPSVPHSPRPLFRPTYWKRGWAWGREQDEGRAL